MVLRLGLAAQLSCGARVGHASGHWRSFIPGLVQYILRSHIVRHGERCTVATNGQRSSRILMQEISENLYHPLRRERHALSICS